MTDTSLLALIRRALRNPRLLLPPVDPNEYEPMMETQSRAVLHVIDTYLPHIRQDVVDEAAEAEAAWTTWSTKQRERYGSGVSRSIRKDSFLAGYLAGRTS